GESAPPRAPIVGRAKELAALDDAIAETRAGRACAVLVHGEPGIGKSALLRELCARIGGDDGVVLAGRCFACEEEPFEGLASVVDSLPRHLCALSDADAAALLPPDSVILARPFPVLRSVRTIAAASEPASTPVDPHEARTRAFRALREILRRMASSRRVL